MRNSKLAFIPLVTGLLACMGSVMAAPCMTASLSAYESIGGGGCSIGSLTLSGFLVEAFPGEGATQIAPASILVTPLANGFQVSSGTVLSAPANDSLGLRFLFNASAPSLTGATVALGEQNSVGPDGAITAILDAGPAGSAIALILETASLTPASFSSAAFDAYNVSLELGISSDTGGPTSLGPVLASITFVTGQAVPEPDTAALSIAGLLAAFAGRRRVVTPV